MTTDAVLSCSGLTKRYDNLLAVDDVGFTIDQGETYGLLGPNGAGKTTTISMVCGLLERDGGKVVVDGREMTTTSTETKKALGYVPQELAIYPDLTARENLAFFGRLYGMERNDCAQRIDEVLDTIGLVDRADDRADEFSGGMKRRLNIGIGLLHRPRLLILDEPTVGVDPQSRNAILEAVAALSGAGMAVLYTTHYMEEAERLCDRVGIIDEGRIEAEGTRRELVSLIGEHDRIHLTASGVLDDAARAAEATEGVRSTSVTEGGLELIVDSARSNLPRILEAVDDAGAEIAAVEVVEPDLEAVFLHLTGKALRD